MKRSLAMAAAMLISFSAVSINVSAAEDETKVFVTISDNNRDLVLVQEPVTVTDIDNDGKLTINDALSITHDNKFEGGAAAGYRSSVGQWGLQLEKLWGIESGINYGYCVNDVFANGLADEIKNGDYINAYVYSDTKNFSDSYSFFDAKNGNDAEAGSEIELKLSYLYFDENFAQQSKALEGAKITVNGKETDSVTDADGKAVVKLTEAGRNVISATSDSRTLVPPSYVINVSGEAVTTTTAAATTTTSSTTTTTSASTTTAAKTTAAGNKSNSPQTGVKGAGLAIAGLITAAAAAFALRRRDEE